MKKAVFLDRDGVLNKKSPPHDYVKSFEEFIWNNGAKDLVREIKKWGFLVIVVSNQQGIALGKMTKKFVDDLHQQINFDLKKDNTAIDAFYYCPHRKEEGCDCRKPKPGLFFQAADDLGIDLRKSFMVGDSESDREAAVAAGCKKTIIIESDDIDVKYIMNEIRQNK